MRAVTRGIGIGLAALAVACSLKPETPAGVAAARNDPTAIRALVAAGAGADGIGPNGVTPLMIAARRGAVGVMKTLLDAGADPNRRHRSRLDFSSFVSGIMEVARVKRARLSHALSKVRVGGPRTPTC